MRKWSRRDLVRLVVAVGLAAPFALTNGARGLDLPFVGVVVQQEYACGANDHVEGDVQGNVPMADQQDGTAELGYNCGLTLLGHTTLGADGRAPNGNGNMAWSGDCAYVAGPGAVFGEPSEPAAQTRGVAVVHVGLDGTPTHVRTLRSRGATDSMETIHAVQTAERAILVVGRYGNQAGSAPNPMDVYDVSDCANPVRLAATGDVATDDGPTFDWPDNVHNLTLTADAMYVYATQPLQVLSLAPLFDGDPATALSPGDVLNIENTVAGAPVSPGPLADLDDPIEDQAWSNTHSGYLSHEAWPSADGSRVYVGGQLPTWETLSVIDMEPWMSRREPPRLISQRQGRGHSVRTATIGGKPFVLHSDESILGPTAGCVPETANPFAGPSQPWLTDISDEERPVTVSQFGLEINEPAYCHEALASNVRTGVHYHDVDDAAQTTFVMASMWNAGIRVFDVRNPTSPREVAYFNPGDVDPSDGVVLDHAWAHVRWIPERNQMWFTTASGGFWVAELQNQVIQQLGLDGAISAAQFPLGKPARAGTMTAAPALRIDPWPMTCTISGVGP